MYIRYLIYQGKAILALQCALKTDKTPCAGDEPLNENCFGYAEAVIAFMHESLLSVFTLGQCDPYEKHHSTVREACELAAYLNVPNLILYHTEDDNIERKSPLYSRRQTVL